MRNETRSLRRWVPMLLGSAFLAVGLSACSDGAQPVITVITPTPSPLPSISPTPSPTPTVTPTPTPTPTVTPTPTPVVQIYGIRGERELVRFSAAAPGLVTSITDLPVQEAVVGLDRRPADDQLYAITVSGRVFLIEITDPVMPTVMLTELQALQTAAGPTLTVGARVGTDFNPAANALRLIDETGVNLRVPPGALSNPAASTSVDTLIDGVMGYRQGVTAAAYTNPAPQAGDTVLFVMDIVTRGIYQQNANEGTLTLTATLPALVQDIGGYDIFQAAATAANEQYALLTIDGSTNIHRVDPTNAAMPLLSALPLSSSLNGTYRGLAVTVPAAGEPEDRRFLLLNTAGETDVINTLILTIEEGATIFSPDTEVVITGPNLSVSGLAEDERLVGIDYRTTASTENRRGVLYGVTNQSRVVALTESGNTLTVMDAFPLTNAAMAPFPLNGERFGVDFNPRADLLRILSDNAQNLRVNLDVGREIAPLGGTAEARVAGYAAVDRITRIVSPNPPQIVATAYRAAPLTESFQFALDARDSSLARVVAPNDGALVRVGPLGPTLPTSGTAMPAEQSFDIAGSDDSLVFAALRPAGAVRSQLYRVDLETGAATLIGSIGANDSAPVNSITVRLE